MSRFANLSAIQPDQADAVPATPIAQIDEAAQRHGFVSREPTVRRKRQKLEGLTDQLNIRALVSDINAFVAWCEENRFPSYKEGFHELMKLTASKK